MKHVSFRAAVAALVVSSSAALSGSTQASAAPAFQIVVPVDTTDLSNKGYLPGWLAISVKCNLFSYHGPGSPEPPKLLGSGSAQNVPAKADANGKAITMVKVAASETNPTNVHATYSCAGSADAIAGTKHLSTTGGPVAGLITNAVTLTPPLIVTLQGNNPPPAQIAPPHPAARGGAIPSPSPKRRSS